MLWTDFIKPNVVTAYSREILNGVDTQPGTLANIFPNAAPVNGTTFKFTTNERSDDMAAYRSFDTESKIGRSAGQEEITVTLPPVSIKHKVSEFEQIVWASGNKPDVIPDPLQRYLTQVVREIVARTVAARAEILQTGALDLDEYGLKTRIDFGRDSKFTTTTKTKWDATTKPGDPIEDLVNWFQQMSNDPYGDTPDTLIVSQQVMAVLMKSPAVSAYFGAGRNGIIGRAEIANLFASYGLPAPQVFTSKARNPKTGKIDFLIDPKKIILANSSAGSTVWGRTAEANDPRYALADSDAPGLVTGLMRTDDPATVWVRGNATVMPILTQANATLAATVLG